MVMDALPCPVRHDDTYGDVTISRQGNNIAEPRSRLTVCLRSSPSFLLPPENGGAPALYTPPLAVNDAFLALLPPLSWTVPPRSYDSPRSVAAALTCPLSPPPRGSLKRK